jgi:transposase
VNDDFSAGNQIAVTLENMATVKPGTLTLTTVGMSTDEVERAKARVWGKTFRPDGDDGCWLYAGYRMKNGYATTLWDGTKRLAHRVSYALAFGETPGDRQINHKCDTRNCLQPKHLLLGTAKENTADMHERRRANKNMTQEQSDQLIEYIAQDYAFTTMTEMQIADKYQVSAGWVARIVKLVARDVDTRGKGAPSLSDDQVRDIRVLYATGEFTMEEVAKRVGCNRQAVYNVSSGKSYRHLHDGSRIAPPERGVSEHVVSEIRRLHAAGEKGIAIAKMLGISQSYVSNVVRGNTAA